MARAYTTKKTKVDKLHLPKGTPFFTSGETAKDWYQLIEIWYALKLQALQEAGLSLEADEEILLADDLGREIFARLLFKRFRQSDIKDLINE